MFKPLFQHNVKGVGGGWAAGPKGLGSSDKCNLWGAKLRWVWQEVKSRTQMGLTRAETAKKEEAHSLAKGGRSELKDLMEMI